MNHFPFQRTSRPSQDSTSVNKDLINSSINMYLDSQALLRKMPELLLTAESKVPVTNKGLLRQSLQPSEKVLGETKESIKERIVDELFSSYNAHLKQVSDIPRLYRKTNRSVPTRPGTYIDVVASSVEQFQKSVETKLDNAFLVQLYQALFNVMTVS